MTQLLKSASQRLTADASAVLTCTFLNLYGSASYAKHSKEILEYINELGAFLQFYCKQRYDLTTQIWLCWPYTNVKTYDDVKKFDALPNWHDATGKTLQLYFGYGLNLRPYEQNYNGYCECLTSGLTTQTKSLQVADLMYVDMPAYDKSQKSFWGSKSIYNQLSDVSRVATHELDHQIGQLLGANWWLHGVHKAALKSTIKWSKITSIAGLEYSRYAHTDGRPYFMSQVDPRGLSA